MTTRTTSILLWIVQALLALLFLFAGVMKLLMPAAALTKQSPFSAPFLRFIGVCECLGAVGLVVPALTRVKPVLTPLAAVGLLIIMIGATALTARMMGIGPAVLPFASGVAAAFVAWGRWQIAPISASQK